MKLVSRYAFAILITSVVGLLFTVDGVSAQNITTCADFSYQEDAQKFYDQGGGRPQDWYGGMDADGDGIACENLPGKPIHKQGWFWPVIGFTGVGLVGGGGYLLNRRSRAESVTPISSMGVTADWVSNDTVGQSSKRTKGEDRWRPEPTSVGPQIINVNVDNRSESRSESVSSSRAEALASVQQVSERCPWDSELPEYTRKKFEDYPLSGYIPEEVLKRMPYNAYLKTYWWKTKSAEAKKRADHRCEMPGCGESSYLEVHHKHYDVGNEKMEHLTVLCRTHHQQIHDDVNHAFHPDNHK